MDTVLYSIFDRITSTYGNFFFAVNDADALRKAKNAFQQSPFALDFALYSVCTVSTDTGEVVTSERRFIANIFDGEVND